MSPRRLATTFSTNCGRAHAGISAVPTRSSGDQSQRPAQRHQIRGRPRVASGTRGPAARTARPHVLHGRGGLKCADAWTRSEVPGCSLSDTAHGTGRWAVVAGGVADAGGGGAGGGDGAGDGGGGGATGCRCGCGGGAPEEGRSAARWSSAAGQAWEWSSSRRPRAIR